MAKHNNLWQVDPKEFFTIIKDDDRIKFLLRYAVLSPSTHNSQPWLFKVDNNKCFIYPDPDKKLPEADPQSRDLYISLGCCLENLAIAARYFGLLDKIEYIPQGFKINEIAPAAAVWFKNGKGHQDSAWLALLEAITQRVNARGLFRKKPIPENLFSQIKKLPPPEGLQLALVSDKNKIKKLARLTAEGITLAYNQKKFRQEAANWINHSFSCKKEGIHGYALKMPALLSFVFPTLIRKFNLGKKLSQLNLVSVRSAPLICVISSDQETPDSWLRIGRLAERLMLEFNAAGVNTSIFVAAVEMGELQQQVKQIVETEKKPQFIFCAGYLPGHHRHTARFAVANKLIN